VSRTNIPHAFYSTCCTMPKFSTSPPRTSTPRTPLTKLSRDNIYPHCVHTNKNLSALCQYCTHHARHYYACAHPVHQYIYIYIYIFFFMECHSAPNLSAQTRVPKFFCAMSNLSVHTHAPIFFRMMPNFCARTRMKIFFHATPNFSACTSMPICFLRSAKF
jgi:hypothetical protein